MLVSLCAQYFMRNVCIFCYQNSVFWLCLERSWNMYVPGFGSTEDTSKPVKKSAISEAHKQVNCSYVTCNFITNNFDSILYTQRTFTVCFVFLLISAFGFDKEDDEKILVMISLLHLRFVSVRYAHIKLSEVVLVQYHQE